MFLGFSQNAERKLAEVAKHPGNAEALTDGELGIARSDRGMKTKERSRNLSDPHVYPPEFNCLFRVNE